MHTITITPAQFGNIAAEAIANGFDVTSYLIRFTQERLLSRPQEIPGEEVVADGRIVLENLDDVVARQKDAEPTVSDFYADIV